MKHISTALNTESMVPIQMFFPVFSRRGLSFMKAVIIFMYLCIYGSAFTGSSISDPGSPSIFGASDICIGKMDRKITENVKKV